MGAYLLELLCLFENHMKLFQKLGVKFTTLFNFSTNSLYFFIVRRFGQKRLRKFEKIDYRLRKAELDLEFLVRCRDNNVIPRSLNFRLSSKSLRSFLTYVQCQSNLLSEKIRQNKSN